MIQLNRLAGLVVAAAWLCSASLSRAQPTIEPPMVRLVLSSPQHNTFVMPSAVVIWTIGCEVDATANLGLAAFSVDLVQSDGNPSFVELSPGSATPLATRFNRPEGICNPGLNGAGSGFGGTPIGVPGRKELCQIGGLQNTFGVAGSVMGLSVTPALGVGHASPAAALATGLIVAPTLPGLYCFQLERGLGSVLVSVSQAPEPSIVAEANVQLDSLLCFTVLPACDPDYTQDGNVDQADIACLINLVGGDPSCSSLDPDFNHDGNADQADVAALVAVIAGEPCP